MSGEALEAVSKNELERTADNCRETKNGGVPMELEGWLFRPDLHAGGGWRWMGVDDQSVPGGPTRQPVSASGRGDSMNECVAAIEQWLRNDARTEQTLLDL